MLQGTQLVREGLAGSNGAALALAGPGEVSADSVSLSVVIDRNCMHPHPRSEPPSVSREAGTSLLGPSSYSCIQPCSFRTAVSLSTSIITDAPIMSSSASFSCEGLDFDLLTRDCCHSGSK